MTRLNQIILLMAFGAGLICFMNCAPYRLDTAQAQQKTVQAQADTSLSSTAPKRLSRAESKEAEIMRLNLNYGAKLAWRAALIRAMLIKANWLANRLELPIRRPIYTTDIQGWQIVPPFFAAVNQGPPSWLPDTTFGTHIYDTNFSRLKRIFAFQIALNGQIATPPYSFSFQDGQVDDISRLDASQGKGYIDRFSARVGETVTSSNAAGQAYQLATNWLASIDVNLTMLEKSRLPHSVHQAKYQPPGLVYSVPVYFVDWGTNYYSMYKPDAPWHPAVTVEISDRKELLELYVVDHHFFRNPPMLIPSGTVWRLVHTPDPSFQQLQSFTGMQEFVMTAGEVSNYIKGFDYITNSTTWKYQHHLLDAQTTMLYSNELKKLNSELIPYTNSL